MFSKQSQEKSKWCWEFRWLSAIFIGGGDHLCPYGRKMIGSVVPVHSRSVWSNTYALLDSSLKLVAFLLNYSTCFPIHIWLFWQTWSVMADLWCSLVEALQVDLVKFPSEIFPASFQFVFCDPGSQLSPRFTDVYLFTLIAWFHIIRLFQSSRNRKFAKSVLRIVFKSLETFLNRFNFPTLRRRKVK